MNSRSSRSRGMSTGRVFREFSHPTSRFSEPGAGASRGRDTFYKQHNNRARLCNRRVDHNAEIIANIDYGTDQDISVPSQTGGSGSNFNSTSTIDEYKAAGESTRNSVGKRSDLDLTDSVPLNTCTVKAVKANKMDDCDVETLLEKFRSMECKCCQRHFAFQSRVNKDEIFCSSKCIQNNFNPNSEMEKAGTSTNASKLQEKATPSGSSSRLRNGHGTSSSSASSACEKLKHDKSKSAEEPKAALPRKRDPFARPEEVFEAEDLVCDLLPQPVARCQTELFRPIPDYKYKSDYELRQLPFPLPLGPPSVESHFFESETEKTIPIKATDTDEARQARSKNRHIRAWIDSAPPKTTTKQEVEAAKVSDEGIVIQQPQHLAKLAKAMPWGPTLELGVPVQVVESEINSVADFYVKTEDSFVNAIKVTEDVYRVMKYKELDKINEFAEGTPCIAPFCEDYYRAEIIENRNEEEVRVFFSDFGNTEVVKKEQCLVIPSPMVEVQRFIYQCVWDAGVANKLSVDELKDIFKSPTEIVPRKQIAPGQFLVSIGDRGPVNKITVLPALERGDS